jgi:molecular chaperone GrpE
MAKKRKAHVDHEPPTEAAEFVDDFGEVDGGQAADVDSDHLLDPGPEVAEEVWEGDEDAVVIEPDDDPDTGTVEVADELPGAPIDSEPDEESDELASRDVPFTPADVTQTEDALADTIDSEIHELATERDSYRDIAQRLQADFENYRKRMGAQLAGEIDRATGKLAEALLPVLDAAEAAYVQHPDEIGPLFNLMLAELRKHGLEPIDLLEKAFDPNLAEAVAHEPGDGGEPIVTEVMRSGYLWNGRTLRPAMVRTRD